MSVDRLKPGAFDQLTLVEAEAKALAYEIEHRDLVQAVSNLQHNRQLLTYRLNKLRREAGEKTS